MRIQIDKKHFTKAERIFARRLTEMHVKFRSKVKIYGREVDFVCGKYAIDIDGHEQDWKKNIQLVQEGYTPLHIDNKSVSKINLSYLK